MVGDTPQGTLGCCNPVRTLPIQYYLFVGVYIFVAIRDDRLFVFHGLQIDFLKVVVVAIIAHTATAA